MTYLITTRNLQKTETTDTVYPQSSLQHGFISKNERMEDNRL
jgi:hypothetical protein